MVCWLDSGVVFDKVGIAGFLDVVKCIVDFKGPDLGEGPAFNPCGAGGDLNTLGPVDLVDDARAAGREEVACCSWVFDAAGFEAPKFAESTESLEFSLFNEAAVDWRVRPVAAGVFGVEGFTKAFEAGGLVGGVVCTLTASVSSGVVGVVCVLGVSEVVGGRICN